MRTIKEVEQQFLGSAGGWNQQVLERFIDNEIQERFDLDYKAAAFLDPNKRDDITKAVSAMANANGGVVIFGIKEYQEKTRCHLPEKIDPVSQSAFSRERLDQILSQIQPVIQSPVIHAVPIDGSVDEAVYVVVVPQSTTAHQATDLKYYHRSNARSVPMQDYQIRDIMNRIQHPRLRVELAIHEYWISDNDFAAPSPKYFLDVYAVNLGPRLARYITCFLRVPPSFEPETDASSAPLQKYFWDGNRYHVFSLSNLKREPIDERNKVFLPIYEPLHPGVSNRIQRIKLNKRIPDEYLGDHPIVWEIFADDAPVERGSSVISH